MKLKNVIYKVLVTVACFLFIFGTKESFSQVQNKVEDKNEIAPKSFEQALKNYDAKKQKEQEELALKLNSSLSQATNIWIIALEKDTEGKLNTLLEQSWEKLARFYPISPAHYEYYLRGYKYTLLKSDVTKTDSLTLVYKGVVIVKEELYVEKNHPVNISDVNPYFYTVGSHYNLNFEYKNEKFTLVNSDSKIVSIENNCPDEIKKLRL